MKIHERSLILLMVCWSATAMVPGSATTPREETDCLPCDTLFTNTHETPSFKRVQQVEMQLRGEPKSGTGMMHQWAWAILYHTCAFLERLYGEDTCHIDRDAEISPNSPITRHSLIFKPSRGGGHDRCVCQGVDSVVISLSKRKKHELPVGLDCIWWRHNGIAHYHESEKLPCPAVGGMPVSNYSEVLGCMAEANCAITDDRPQLIVLRDPRPVAVSSYYHRKRRRDDFNETLEDFVLKILPRICMWVTIRHELFTRILSSQSTVYWYHEAVSDPLDWHYKYLNSVGLHLPLSVVESVKDAALREAYPFKFKHRDIHDEKSLQEVSPNRSWEVEVSRDLAEAMNRVVRVWLPPVLLEKLGISIA